MDPNSMRNEFIKFVGVVIRRALQFAGVQLTSRFQLLEETENLFILQFATKLYRYRCAIEYELAAYTRTIPIPIRTLTDYQTLMQWMENGERECFNCTPNPILGVLRYMVFLVDICIYLYHFSLVAEIEDILMRIGLVFDTIVRGNLANDVTFLNLEMAMAGALLRKCQNLNSNIVPLPS